MASVLHAKDSLKTSQDQLQNIVFLVGSALNNLIKGSNNDAANNEPFDASHDDFPRRGEVPKA